MRTTTTTRDRADGPGAHLGEPVGGEVERRERLRLRKLRRHRAQRLRAQVVARQVERRQPRQLAHKAALQLGDRVGAQVERLERRWQPPRRDALHSAVAHGQAHEAAVPLHPGRHVAEALVLVQHKLPRVLYVLGVLEEVLWQPPIEPGVLERELAALELLLLLCAHRGGRSCGLSAASRGDRGPPQKLAKVIEPIFSCTDARQQVEEGWWTFSVVLEVAPNRSKQTGCRAGPQSSALVPRRLACTLSCGHPCSRSRSSCLKV